MARSIISNERECLFCGTTQNLHKHHIFHGAGRRKTSEQDGCWCYLCAAHHNMSDWGVHQDHMADVALKRRCQRKWEEVYGDRDAFIRRYGISYL